MKRKIHTALTLLCALMIGLAALSIPGLAAVSQALEGNFKSVNGTTVVVADYSDKSYSLTLSPTAVLTIDDRPVTIKEFKPEMEVSVQYSGKNLLRMDGYSTQNPGYLSPGGQMRQGTISFIDRDQIRIKSPGGQEDTYYTTPATFATRQGKSVPLSSLYVGDRVQLYLDEADSILISRIQAEGESVLVKNLYRGRLLKVDEMGGKVALQNLQVFRNGAWQDLKSNLTLPYYDFRTAPVYMGGKKLPLPYLKFFQGKQVYLAMKDVLGKERIARMIVQSDSAVGYSEKIEAVNWYSQSLELANKKNLTFGDGTLIVKSNRLVDAGAVTAGLDAFILAEGRAGNGISDLIYIYNETINPSNIGEHRLYAGKLDTVYQDKAIIEDFFLLEENAWQSFRDDQELSYDDDTRFFNADTQTFITRKAFYTGAYKADQDDVWFGYAFTDGTRVAAMALYKDMDSLLNQRTTIGVVNSVTESATVGWVAELRDVRDWSKATEMWTPKDAPVRFNLDKALILRDNAVIAPEELQAGETLYVVRDDFNGKIVIVK